MFEIFRRQVTLIRAQGHYNLDGYYVEDSIQRSSILAGIQNATPNLLLTLEEAYRTKDIYVVYTAEELTVGDVATGKQADKIEIDSKLYQVLSAKKPQMLFWCSDHCEAIIVKCDEDN